MPKKRIVFLIILIFSFIFGEKYYEKNIREDLENINKFIVDAREEDLIKKENELIDAYNFDDYLDYKIEYSKVLFRDIYNMNRTITIYKGSNDGIKKNNLVINQKGLVGIIKKANKNSSVVELLYNENLNMSVLVKGYYGILEYQNGKLIIEGINNIADIQVGDKVTTSDISIYPDNIFVGEVSEINYDKYEIEQILTVEPAVDFDSIRYVGIITDLRGVE